MSEFIDAASAALADRARPQVANHVRSIAEQTLDALLRIEELLTVREDRRDHDASKLADVVPPPPMPKGGKRNPRSL